MSVENAVFSPTSFTAGLETLFLYSIISIMLPSVFGKWCSFNCSRASQRHDALRFLFTVQTLSRPNASSSVVSKQTS